MKKLLLFLFILVIPITSFAEWSFISQGDDGAVYVDFKNVKETNGKVYYWKLKQGQKIRALDSAIGSIKVYKVVNCESFGDKILQASSHSKPMGIGEILDSWNPKEDWNYPEPGSIDHILIESLCKK